MKINSLNILLLLALCLSFSTACEQTNSTVRNEVRLENEKANEKIKEDWKAEQEALTVEIKKTQQKIENRIQALHNDLTTAKDNTKTEIQEQIKTLAKRKELLEADLEKIENRVADNWEAFRSLVNEHLEEAQEIFEEDI